MQEESRYDQVMVALRSPSQTPMAVFDGSDPSNAGPSTSAQPLVKDRQFGLTNISATSPAINNTDSSEEGKRSPFKYAATIVLENNGSVARDHLASERTFLAYVRTSLAIASAGVGESGGRSH